MSNNGSQQFEFHPLELSQLDAVLALEQEALDNLERPVRGELVGFAVLYVPAKGDAEDLSALLVQVDATPYISANFKICIVHPRWRGRHLQVLLGKQLHQEATNRGIELLCATVSPYSQASVKSLTRLGYCPDHSLQKYGYERMLFYQFVNQC